MCPEWRANDPDNRRFVRGATYFRLESIFAAKQQLLEQRRYLIADLGPPLMQFVNLLAQRSERPRREHSLHRQPKVLSDLEGQFQRRGIVPALQKPDRLWIHAPGQSLFRPKDRNAIMKRHNAFINRFVSYKQYPAF